jgi:hypothetical protein
MTTDQMQVTIIEAEAAAVIAKLDLWTRQLTPRERAYLGALLLAATAGSDVAGFLLVDDGSSGTPTPRPPDPRKEAIRVMQTVGFRFLW